MFELRVGDIVRVESTKTGEKKDGTPWQKITIETGDAKTPHMDFFLEEINDSVHDGDFIRIDDVVLSGGRMFKVSDRSKIDELIKSKAGMYISYWAFNAKVSIAENQLGFDTPMMDVGDEQLPF